MQSGQRGEDIVQREREKIPVGAMDVVFLRAV